jgi:hypothetical protein
MEFSFEFLAVGRRSGIFAAIIWLILLIELYEVRHANSWKDTLADQPSGAGSTRVF